MSENTIFPGDKIASIEEYEAGNNAFDDGDMVRAATVGEKDIDKETRTVNVTSKTSINTQSRRRHHWNSCSCNVIYDCSFNRLH